MNCVKSVAGLSRKLALSVFCVTAIVSSQIAGAASSAWAPDGVVEIIVNTAPGSSPDKTARLMQKIFQEGGFVAIPTTVVNKPGGGGAVAYTYLNQHSGSGNFIAVASKTLLTSHIMGRSPITYTHVTPLAHLFGEYIAVAVKADSPIKSGKDLIERLKRDPSAHSFGVATSLGNTNHQGVAAALKVSGIDPRALRTVVFQSGGRAITALLGGHVDAVPVSLGSWRPYIEKGSVRVIAVAAPERLAGIYAQIPTWREQGANSVVANWRSMVGPKGMRADQIAYWEAAIKGMMEADAWKKQMEAISAASQYMDSTKTTKYMADDYADIKSFLIDLELAKR